MAPSEIEPTVAPPARRRPSEVRYEGLSVKLMWVLPRTVSREPPSRRPRSSRSRPCVYSAVFAALLAQRGMTGPSPIFEGEKGFMKLVSRPFELPPLAGEQLPGHAPVPFRILDTYIKHFPVEYHAQTAVEAALALRNELIEAEGPQAIERLSDIEIGSYDVAIEIIGRDPEKWQPTTRETADHSFP